MSYTRTVPLKKIRQESKYVNDPALRHEVKSIADALHQVERPISQSSSLAIEVKKPAVTTEVKDDSSGSTTDNMNWSLLDQDDDNPARDVKSKAFLPAVDVALFCEEISEPPFKMENGALAPDGHYYKLAGRLTIEVYDVKSKQCIKTIPIPEFKEEDLNYGCEVVSSIEELSWSNILVTGNHHIILWHSGYQPYKTIILDPDTHQIKHELNNCMLHEPFHLLNESQFICTFASKESGETGSYLFDLTTEKFTRKRLDTPILMRPSGISYHSHESLPNGKVMMSAFTHIFTLADGRIVEGAKIINPIDGIVEGETKPAGVTKMQFGIQLEKWGKDINGDLIREAVLPLQYEAPAALSEIGIISSNAICLSTFVHFPNAGRKKWQLNIIDTDRMKVIKDLGRFCKLQIFSIGSNLLLHEENSDKIYILHLKNLELQEENLPCKTSQLRQISDYCFLIEKEDGKWMKVQIAYGLVTSEIADSITCLPMDLVKLVASYYPKIVDVTPSKMGLFASSTDDVVAEIKNIPDSRTKLGFP